MDDKRRLIIDCALTELRQGGYAAFSQIKVAKRAGLRQSHLTYYYPTRVDLLLAVAEAAMERQVAALDDLLASAPPKKAPEQIVVLLGRKENARVLLALVQGVEEEPRLHTLFVNFATQIRERIASLLAGEGRRKTVATDAYLLHALCVGLAVLGLALDQDDDGDKRKINVIKTAIRLLAADAAAE